MRDADAPARNVGPAAGLEPKRKDRLGPKRGKRSGQAKPRENFPDRWRAETTRAAVAGCGPCCLYSGPRLCRAAPARKRAAIAVFDVKARAPSLKPSKRTPARIDPDNPFAAALMGLKDKHQLRRRIITCTVARTRLSPDTRANASTSGCGRRVSSRRAACRPNWSGRACPGQQPQGGQARPRGRPGRCAHLYAGAPRARGPHRRHRPSARPGARGAGALRGSAPDGPPRRPPPPATRARAGRPSATAANSTANAGTALE